MNHIFEHGGVLLDVSYTPAPPGDLDGPTIHSARVLDGDYKPTGPDIVGLLHGAHIIHPPGADGFSEAETFLSAIAGEIS